MKCDGLIPVPLPLQTDRQKGRPPNAGYRVRTSRPKLGSPDPVDRPLQLPRRGVAVLPCVNDVDLMHPAVAPGAERHPALRAVEPPEGLDPEAKVRAFGIGVHGVGNSKGENGSQTKFHPWIRGKSGCREFSENLRGVTPRLTLPLREGLPYSLKIGSNCLCPAFEVVAHRPSAYKQRPLDRFSVK